MGSALVIPRRQPSRRLGDTSIQIKLLVPTLGMLGLLLAVTLATNLYALDHFEAQVNAARLGEEQALVRQHFDAELEGLSERALAMALDENLLRAVADHDAVGVQRLGVQLRVRHRLELLQVVDRDSRLLFGDQGLQAGLADELGLALATIERARVLAGDGGALIVAAVPLKGAAGVHGAMLIGRAVDDAFLRRINADRSDPVIQLYDEAGRTLATSAAAGVERADPLQAEPGFLQRVLGGEQAEEDVLGADGEPRRALYAALAPGDSSRLLYSVALSSAEVQAYRVRTLHQSAAVLGAVALVAAGLLTYSIRGGIIGPLRRLSRAVERLGAGELELELAPEGGDEIGRLTESFSAMAGQLRQSFAGLEARNRMLEREIAERKRVEEARAQLEIEVTQAQATILELSTPIIPIDSQTLVMPLVGVLDAERARQALRALAGEIEARQARVVILDITGVPMVDAQIARALLDGAAAAHLLGARAILTGIGPEAAQSIVGLGVELDALGTYGTLQQAIVAVRRQPPEGRKMPTS